MPKSTFFFSKVNLDLLLWCGFKGRNHFGSNNLTATCIESGFRLDHMTRCHDNSNCDSDVWIWSLRQVWNSNSVKDKFMGQVVLSGLPKDSPNPQKLQLRKGGRHTSDEMPGSITLKIVTATQLTSIWPLRWNWLRSIFLQQMFVFLVASLGERKGNLWWTECQLLFLNPKWKDSLIIFLYHQQCFTQNPWIPYQKCKKTKTKQTL